MKLSRPAYWSIRNFISYLLLPVSLLYRGIISLRSLCYCIGVSKSWRSPVPVIVVGNIVVGGAGKSPLVIALCDLLVSKNIKPGIVARGYGGDSVQAPVVVTRDSNPQAVGDECVMLAARTNLPVVACANRVMAVKHLLSIARPDIVISDDGLQHYALQRDFEIAVIDADYQCGNGFCLPAGPLREPQSRLNSVDMVVYSGEQRRAPGYVLQGDMAVSVSDSATRVTLASFKSSPVHAVAGIASPARFFSYLKAHGLQVIENPKADHTHYVKEDFMFGDNLPVLMTQKDWVKVRDYDLENCWYVPVTAALDEQIINEFLTQTQSMLSQSSGQ